MTVNYVQQFKPNIDMTVNSVQQFKPNPVKKIYNFLHESRG
jgi:hypothetical protein